MFFYVLLLILLTNSQITFSQTSEMTQKMTSVPTVPINSTEFCILLCTYGCKGGYGASCCSKEAFEDPNCVQCKYGGGCRRCRKGFVYDGFKCLYKHSKNKCKKERQTFKGRCRCIKQNGDYYCV